MNLRLHLLQSCAFSSGSHGTSDRLRRPALQPLAAVALLSADSDASPFHRASGEGVAATEAGWIGTSSVGTLKSGLFEMSCEIEARSCSCGDSGAKPSWRVSGLPMLLGVLEPLGLLPAGPSCEDARRNGRLPPCCSGGEDLGEYREREREDVEIEAESSSEEESAPGYRNESARAVEHVSTPALPALTIPSTETPRLTFFVLLASVIRLLQGWPLLS